MTHCVIYLNIFLITKKIRHLRFYYLFNLFFIRRAACIINKVNNISIIILVLGKLLIYFFSLVNQKYFISIVIYDRF